MTNCGGVSDEWISFSYKHANLGCWILSSEHNVIKKRGTGPLVARETSRSTSAGSVGERQKASLTSRQEGTLGTDADNDVDTVSIASWRRFLQVLSRCPHVSVEVDLCFIQLSQFTGRYGRKRFVKARYRINLAPSQ